MAENKTIMTQAKSTNMTASEMQKYALFLGGTNATHDVLNQYDPLKTGYGRLFMVRVPTWVDKSNHDAMQMFKHMLEYGNTKVSGLNDYSVNFEELKGGYNGKSFAIPTAVEDGTNTLTVGVYEFSGSPIRTLLHTWINGTIDLQTGLSHYNGISTEDAPRLQSNQTAEFIYVNTDNTGREVEYACLFANCFPSNINIDPFNYESGTHQLVETDVEFRTTKYESIQINKVATELITKYRIVANSLNFYSGITSKQIGDGITYSPNDQTIASGGPDPNDWEKPGAVDPHV
jgi:hypothetical protein